MCAYRWLKEEYGLLPGGAEGEGNVALAPAGHLNVRLRGGKGDHIFLCICLTGTNAMVSLLCLDSSPHLTHLFPHTPRDRVWCVPAPRRPDPFAAGSTCWLCLNCAVPGSSPRLNSICSLSHRSCMIDSGPRTSCWRSTDKRLWSNQKKVKGIKKRTVTARGRYVCVCVCAYICMHFGGRPAIWRESTLSRNFG